MRTTLTLDDDLAAALKREAAHSGRSFKETLNDSLRLGLSARKTARELPRFKVRARDLEPRPGVDFENVSALLEEIEGPWYR